MPAERPRHQPRAVRSELNHGVAFGLGIGKFVRGEPGAAAAERAGRGLQIEVPADHFVESA